MDGVTRTRSRSSGAERNQIKRWIEDFGAGSPTATALMQPLAKALAKRLDPEKNYFAKGTFEKWKRLYGPTKAPDADEVAMLDKHLGFAWDGPAEDSLSGRLFVMQSYHAMLIKLIVLETLSGCDLTRPVEPARTWSKIEDDWELMNVIWRQVEMDKAFRKAGVRYFVTSLWFSWFLIMKRTMKEASEIGQGLRMLLKKMAEYNAQEPEDTRDMLRDLYQALIPASMRKSMGEFYTPDWLVDLTLEKTLPDNLLGKTVLDPNCGSGAFLIAVLRKMRADCKASLWDSEYTLKHLCKSIAGFDINPIAVQAASANFLMEIVDMMAPGRNFTVLIPISMMDATQGDNPRWIGLKKPKKYDYIVGNPPWVKWTKLPESYREEIKDVCDNYGMMPKNKRHGGNELDFSAIITYAVADKLLKKGGKIGFVITGSLFKSPSASGFRQFRFEEKTWESNETMYLTPISVDDMKALKPFSDASNHTVIAVFKKDVKPVEYPVDYWIWEKGSLPGRGIRKDAIASEIISQALIIQKEAVPVGSPGSPWAVLAPGRIGLMKKLSGKCQWVTGRKGINTDLNGVYFVKVLQEEDGLVQVESRPEAGRKDLGEARTAWIEAGLLYPLIKGAGDFEANRLLLEKCEKDNGPIYALVPNAGIEKRDYEESRAMMESPEFCQTRAWFEGYKTILNERSTYRRQMDGAPFYALYNVGPYTFMPWKVIWPEMSSRFYAAVAGSARAPGGERPYVPDHKIYFAAFEEKEPACFLCGILNTPIVREWIESHTISIQVGNIFKHLNVPKYDAKDVDHVYLSKLVGIIHQEEDQVKAVVLTEEAESLGELILSRWQG